MKGRILMVWKGEGSREGRSERKDSWKDNTVKGRTPLVWTCEGYYCGGKDSDGSDI